MRFENQRTPLSPHKIFYFNSIVFISEMLGVSNFNQIKKKNFLWRHYRFFVIVAFVSSYFYFIPTFKTWEKKALFNRALLCMETHLRFACLLSVILIQYLQNKRINQVFVKCLKFEVSSNEDAFKSVYFFPIVNALKNITEFVFVYIFFSITNDASYLGNLFFTTLLIYMECPSLQFSYLVFAVTRYMVSINENLERILNEENTVKLDRTMVEMISYHRQKQLELVELTKLIIAAYSFQITICTFDFLFEMIFYLQSSFTNLVINRNNLRMWDAWIFFSNSLLVLLLFFKVAQIAQHCEKTKHECSRMNVLINKIINSGNISTACNSELREFLLQNINQKSDFSILGLYTLDYKLVYSVICSVSSYGIVIAIYNLAYLKQK